LELKSNTLETKLNEYSYQLGKEVHINSLQGQTKILWNLDEEELKSPYPAYPSDKPYSWSPKGTYLVVIQSEKVDFVGGPNMKPILTIPEQRVESVQFSPCERYLMVY